MGKPQVNEFEFNLEARSICERPGKRVGLYTIINVGGHRPAARSVTYRGSSDELVNRIELSAFDHGLRIDIERSEDTTLMLMRLARVDERGFVDVCIAIAAGLPRTDVTVR